MNHKPVSYDKIRDAFDFVSFGRPSEHEAYLCLETGETHWHSDLGDDEEPLPEDIDEPAKYLSIPHKKDLDLGQRLALRFAQQHLPESYETIRAFFGRPGAYARLKDLLDARGLLQQWYDYEEAATDEALRQWCEDNGIALDG